MLARAVPGARHRLRILHLSDLHHRGPRELERARWARVLGDKWFANLAELRTDGAFDLVVFTGDVAFTGALDEYLEVLRYQREDGTVATWLDDTLAAVGCTRAQLYVVPGNHDIARRVHPAAWRRVRNAWPVTNPVEDDQFARWIVQDRDPPRGMTAKLRAELLARQDGYRAWVRDGLGRAELVPDPRRSHLGYRVAAPVARLPFPVHVIGLDSAWLAGDDSDARKLRLTDDQVLRLCSDRDGESLTGLRIALIHHPLGDLADGERARRLLQEKGVGLLLSGHLHESEAREIATPDGRLRDIATGCLYQHDRYPNAVTALTLDLGDSGDIERIELRFRSWSDRGHWHDDNGLYAGARDGRRVWFAGTSATPATHQPEGLGQTRTRAIAGPAARKHTILFLAANPQGTSRLALDEECAEIERTLRATSARDGFDLQSRWAVSVDDMMHHLAELRPTIIHFSGHGSGDAAAVAGSEPPSAQVHRDMGVASSGGIQLQDRQRQPQHVTGRALARMIQSAGPAARVVVLNSCFSDGLAEALRDVVDCVVGMRGSIADDTARPFAVGFYRALGNRSSVGNAVAQATATLAALGLADDLPICLTRDGITADQVVLTPRDADQP